MGLRKLYAEETSQSMESLRKIKDLAEQDRPYEKCLQLGAASLTDAELLAVLLRTGTKGSPSVK